MNRRRGKCQLHEHERASYFHGPVELLLLFKIRRIGMVGRACLDVHAWGREEKCGAGGKLMVW